MKLSVIITVYSETAALAETVERLLSRDRGYIHEVLLVVSPASSQACMSMCRQLADRHPLVKVIVQRRNPGLGRAFREGMEAATGTHVAMLSADLETEPEAVDRMVREVESSGCDVAVASRWLPGGGFARYSPVKLLLNWLFQKVFSRLYATGIGDLTYGLKILDKSLADRIRWEGTLHEICIETTVKPIRYGYAVRQVPTVWAGRTEGVSRNSFFKNLRYVWLAVKVRLKPVPRDEAKQKNNPNIS
ncbi:MAG: glycosyltransferase family 2 protein [Thermodesulfobacteriota bacterium]